MGLVAIIFSQELRKSAVYMRFALKASAVVQIALMMQYIDWVNCPVHFTAVASQQYAVINNSTERISYPSIHLL